ncbi:MAG: EAL domain-containing protein [Rhodospirillales bacterium]|nr:EAL domain-containing protein [Rhodospirillales bacterium]MBO6786389.1 EAL domain-containing protein [Rhodospirillales bacterium]
MSQDLSIKFCTGPAQAFFGKQDAELIGLNFLDIIHADDRSIVKDIFTIKSRDARVDDLMVRAATHMNAAAEIAISGYRVPDFDNDYFLAIKIAPKQTVPIGRKPEDRDTESGVLSNDAFVDAATQRVRSYEAAGGKPKVSMINIGDLSEAGIQAGSAQEAEVLKAIGHTLSQQSLGGDTAGRIDDENFSIVHGDDVDAIGLSEKISNALSVAAPQAKSLVPKIATVDAKAGGMDDKQLAKAMLYSLQEFTKHDGELPEGDLNSILEKKMEENVKDVERFKKICADGSFDLVYMPVASLKDGHFHHFEALTRFHEAAGESPFQLITLAEEVGIIPTFDLAVAERSILTIEAAKNTGPFTPIAINVSGHSISDPHFCSDLKKLLTERFGNEDHLSLEITESAEITDLEGVNEAIQQFRRIGFKVALDDFGAGAASFDYLNSFDVDTVKFDGPVVKRAVSTKKGKAFLASMATLCHEIEVETIAEMVEDLALAEFLGNCGIELGQGWHFGKPMPTEEAFPGIELNLKKPGGDAEFFEGQSLMERISSGNL